MFVLAALCIIGLPLYAAGPMGTFHPTSQVVFVDKAELAKLHPGWQALNDMKAVLGGGNLPRAGIDRTGSVRQVAPVGRSRSELAAKAARDMSAALDELEARKYEALRVRREAMKAQLLKSAEADWKADARGIEEAAALETKKIDQKNSVDLVNARIKMAASEVESKISKKADSGMDKAMTDVKLLSAKEELAGVGSADEAEKNRVMAVANAKINEIKQAAEKQVEKRVSAYESEQSKLIAQGMAAARVETAQGLGPASTPTLFAGWHKEGANGLADLSAAVSALQARIDKDVSLMALQLAARKGLKVVFERQRANLRDATKQFAGLIKKYGWNAHASLMSGLGSV